MSDQPTQEEIERVRAWQEQRQRERADQQRVENDERWAKKVAGLESLVGARIVNVEYQREEKAGYSSYHGTGVEQFKITFDTGATIEYEDLKWSESHIFNIKASENEWIV